ncbi:MAG TPA: fused MFS/spermidine synthase [Anaerolineales bacterium]|nr:fused MFS/spermidine synthase [Anaerolineales bacterium]
MTTQPKRKFNFQLIWVAVLFLFSGAAGLIYQIVWERLLETYFGVTMTSITLIVAAYMAGLGIGSLAGGRIAHKLKYPILTYGLVELGIAAFGMVSPALIHWMGRETAGSPYPLVFLLSFTLLIIPTFLMGMTLPLLTQSFVNRVETSGHIIGLLYGINTLGAAFGTLIAGYLLIGWLGFGGALWVAVGINVAVGVGAVALIGNQEQLSAMVDTETGIDEQRAELSYRRVLFAAFLVGFINLGFEMLWFRVLGIINKGTAYGFPSVLFVFLAGLAIGGLIWGNRADTSNDRAGLFWKLQLGTGIVAATSFLLIWVVLHIQALQPWISEYFRNPQHPAGAYFRLSGEFILSRRMTLGDLSQYFLPILVLVLPASLIMGGGLPLLDRIAITSAKISGRRVGDIHLANIFGSLSGSLVISFILLDQLGTELTLKILALLSIAFTAVVFRSFNDLNGNYLLLPACILILVLILPWRGKFYERLFQTTTGIPAIISESMDSVLAIGYRSTPATPSTMWIGGIQNSFYPTRGTYERSALSCASASQPKTILIIGIGGSNTAYFLTQMPGVEEITIVELMDDLGPLIRQYAAVAQRTLDDPRVTYIGDDGRRFLYANPGEKYDMIFIDPLYSFTSGHNNLYSREAMLLYQAHLEPGGVFCAWFNEGHIIPNTAASVFPFVNQFREWLAAGNEHLEYDRQYLEIAYTAYITNSQGLFADSMYEMINPDDVLSKFVADRNCIQSREADSPILTDLNPWLEYYFFRPPIEHQLRCR